jgi:hypothetical protein
VRAATPAAPSAASPPPLDAGLLVKVPHTVDYERGLVSYGIAYGRVPRALPRRRPSTLACVSRYPHRGTFPLPYS